MSSNSKPQTTRPPGIGDNGDWVNGVFYKLFFYKETYSAERGPIDEGLLEALKLCGHLEKNTLIREKNSNIWKRLDGKPVKQSQSPPPINRGSAPTPSHSSDETKNSHVFLAVLGIIAVIVILAIVVGANSDNSSSNRSSSYASSSGNAYTPTTTTTTEPTPTRAPVPVSTPIIPVYTPTPYPSPTYSPVYSSSSYGQNSGAVYRVPHYTSQNHNFSARKALLDATSNQLDKEKSQLEALGNEIDRSRLYLNTSSQYEIDAFNAKVNAYNYQKRQLKAKFDTFNSQVDQYNRELEAVGRRE